MGARLDQRPELLFRLNQVDEYDLIAKAGDSLALANRGPAAAKLLGVGEDLAELFGLDMQQSTADNNKFSDILAPRKKAITAKAVMPRPQTRAGQATKQRSLVHAGVYPA